MPKFHPVPRGRFVLETVRNRAVDIGSPLQGAPRRGGARLFRSFSTVALECALLVGALAAGAAGASPWAGISTPTPGPARVIGAVSNGCIEGARLLPETGPGYVSVRRERNRAHGHPRLLDFVADLGQAQSRRDRRVIMIGDLAQPRGGRMASSHLSHQTGLDVDIWLTLADSPAAAWRLMDGRPNPPGMVDEDGRSVNARWGADQRFLIETAARHPAVDRLFVNAAIKQALCDRVGGPRDWLRLVRPWRGHDAHVHARLKCPPDSPLCEAQPDLPAGDGCGAELAWWFTEEARGPLSGRNPETAGQPPPAACAALLERP